MPYQLQAQLEWQAPRIISASQLTTVSDHNLLGCLATLRPHCLNLFDDIHAIGDRSEDDMLPIKPICFHCAEEELGAIGAGSCIRHRQDTGTSVLQSEVFICKLSPID